MICQTRRHRRRPLPPTAILVLNTHYSYWLRPSFIFSYRTGTVDELAYPLLLAAHDVPLWLLTLGFGHHDMFWYRLIERLGRNSRASANIG